MSNVGQSFARGLMEGVAASHAGTSLYHALAQHGDPCDCPPELQRQWRGRRRLAGMLHPMRRGVSRFMRWLEWQVGR